MEGDKIGIDVLIHELCGKNARRRCKELYDAFDNDLMYISDHYMESAVDEAELLRLLKKSRYNNKLQFCLPDILFLILPESFTDGIIDFCIHYPGKYKETLLITLGHIPLTPNQLEVLNMHLTTAEAYSQLFVIYVSDSNCPIDRLSTLLRQNPQYLDDAKYCVETMLQDSIKTANDEKLAVLKDYKLI